jgi:pantoate--beta-alanine ligase
VAVDTIRESDGLAKSSRNVYLSDQERREATELNKSLQLAKQKIENGLSDVKEIVDFMKEYINNNTSGIVDYIEIYSYPDLKPIENINEKKIIALAVKFSKVRLIDNIIF